MSEKFYQIAPVGLPINLNRHMFTVGSESILLLCVTRMFWVFWQFFVSPKLATFVLSVVPPVSIIAVLYGRYLRKLTKVTQDSLAQATQVKAPPWCGLHLDAQSQVIGGQTQSNVSNLSKKYILCLVLALQILEPKAFCLLDLISTHTSALIPLDYIIWA